MDVALDWMLIISFWGIFEGAHSGVQQNVYWVSAISAEGRCSLKCFCTKRSLANNECYVGEEPRRLMWHYLRRITSTYELRNYSHECSLDRDANGNLWKKRFENRGHPAVQPPSVIVNHYEENESVNQKRQNDKRLIWTQRKIYTGHRMYPIAFVSSNNVKGIDARKIIMESAKIYTYVNILHNGALSHLCKHTARATLTIFRHRGDGEVAVSGSRGTLYGICSWIIHDCDTFTHNEFC